MKKKVLEILNRRRKEVELNAQYWYKEHAKDSDNVHAKQICMQYTAQRQELEYSIAEIEKL